MDATLTITLNLDVADQPHDAANTVAKFQAAVVDGLQDYLTGWTLPTAELGGFNPIKAHYIGTDVEVAAELRRIYDGVEQVTDGDETDGETVYALMLDLRKVAARLFGDSPDAALAYNEPAVTA